jgi:hypothetical protein
MAGKGSNTRDARLRKSGTERKRREKVHRRRLIALGVSEEKVRRMTTERLRQALQKLTVREQRVLK